MNVTISLPDELVRAARHRAGDELKSLSVWMADVVTKELERSPAPAAVGSTLADALTLENAPEWFFERDFPLEDRKLQQGRGFSFDADEIPS